MGEAVIVFIKGLAFKLFCVILVKWILLSLSTRNRAAFLDIFSVVPGLKICEIRCTVPIEIIVIYGHIVRDNLSNIGDEQIHYCQNKSVYNMIPRHSYLVHEHIDSESNKR